MSSGMFFGVDAVNARKAAEMATFEMMLCILRRFVTGL